MIFSCKPDTAPQLLDAEDFKAFKLAFDGYVVGQKPVLDGVRYLPDDHAFVSQRQVIRAAGQQATLAWREAFAAMVSSAAKYGWVDPHTQDIKVHIQWQ
ncbi:MULTISPECIES: hypothetical protein [Pseudomonas]|jgi:hypothetical protein|uniref:Enoyl-CoA hydratase n=1 Tax=Pseudomonas putida (strain DOT-T1E) TaxID=1196325 RepID=I7C476_PSEPT|nr:MULTISPECIES: hypothetical protein [Pseudomonas]ADR60074.1 Putative enoyl-CoA hydratase (PaaG-like) [Pseudomonas putida BIRD-1]AFO51267.1 putative enoyl-CoA hydratase [Pseudomonas putida DOT-T1E]AOX09457.1 enoyl-CoA hydratase [Pseudomonas putida JB]MCI1025847.1 enoyl-CoA hydratase [Pseudomonas putida]MDN4511840.1 enoyl-CoA hydratase [Pseudomonas sp. 2,4-D]